MQKIHTLNMLTKNGFIFLEIKTDGNITTMEERRLMSI